MFRFVIVAGPNRGSSFALLDGENSIGRQMDNHIVLSSAKVSKRHCVLLVRANEVLLRDDTSTNGTFVNGSMVRRQEIKSGDKVGVGDFVMELVQAGAPANVGGNTNGMGYLAQGKSMNLSVNSPVNLSRGSTSHVSMSSDSQVRTVSVPDDLPGKLGFFFENKIMPFFYGTLMKTEYRSIVAALFAAVVLIAVMGSIIPMEDLAEKSVRREALLRSRVLAREVADRFLPAVATHTEAQIDLSLLEGEESVKIVAIVNPDLQIIAPQSRLNQLFAGGKEASFAMMMANAFKDGREQGSGILVDPTTAVYIEPIKTTDPKQVKSQVSAMAIVSIDFSSNLLQSGGIGVAYGIGFVVAGLAAFFAYMITLRLSFKPYEVLNEDLDQVLRGELPRVTKEFKIEEMEALWNNVNAAVQRIPKGGSSSDYLTSAAEAPVNWDHEFAPARALAEASQQGFIGFDSSLRVVAMNPQFEEISGIRVDSIGQTLQQIARDQSFVLLVNDL